MLHSEGQRPAKTESEAGRSSWQELWAEEGPACCRLRYGSESLSCCFPLVAVGCPAAQRPRDFWEKALPRGETKLRVGTVERGGEISLPGCERSFSLRSPGTAWTAVQDGIGQGTMHPEAPELGGGASGEREVPRCVLGQRS